MVTHSLRPAAVRRASATVRARQSLSLSLSPPRSLRQTDSLSLSRSLSATVSAADRVPGRAALSLRQLPAQRVRGGQKQTQSGMTAGTQKRMTPSLRANTSNSGGEDRHCSRNCPCEFAIDEAARHAERERLRTFPSRRRAVAAPNAASAMTLNDDAMLFVCTYSLQSIRLDSIDM